MEQNNDTPINFPLALDVQHPDYHRAADAFWTYWRENGETHKRGYYESTWGAINRAIRMVGVVPWSYGGQASSPQKTAGEPPSDDAQALADVNALLVSLLVPLGRTPPLLHSSARMRPILLAAKQMLEARQASEELPPMLDALRTALDDYRREAEVDHDLSCYTKLLAEIGNYARAAIIRHEALRATKTNS
jgi:hypothetical protein